MKNKRQNLLKKELGFYRKEKNKSLKPYKGQFVLIKDAAFIGSFTNSEGAYNAGVEKFGEGPFLVKKVEDEQEAISYPALSLGLLHGCP